MFNLYRRSQEAQYRWIREHPVQYVILNVTLLAAWIGYIEYRDRKWTREFNENYTPQPDA